MAFLDTYRNIICQKLSDYAKIPYAYGEIKIQTVFEKETDCYLILTVGWQADRRIHGCLVHIDIIGDKLWIQRDGTEYGIAEELADAGIPRENIVLGFHPSDIRKYTDYYKG
ncbi:MAG: XisI protein [Desulfobacteraceae bacterium IS3]|nr:MAG: XisI protein [Desulfobacteraceae bacterium IS3]